jgi:hypothetical protein
MGTGVVSSPNLEEAHGVTPSAWRDGRALLARPDRRVLARHGVSQSDLVGLKNLVSDAPSRILMGHAARWYSLISPPRICFRSTRASIGIVVRSVEEFGASGGRWPRERCVEIADPLTVPHE